MTHRQLYDSTTRLIPLLTFLVSLMAVMLFHPQVGRAQSSQPIDLAVGPPTSYLHLKPGTTTSHRLTIEQQGTLPLEIAPTLVDFVSDGKTGQPVLKDSSSFRYATLSLPANSTGSVPPDTHSFTLMPKQKKNIAITFTIPEGATQGEYPLTVLFRAKPDTSTTLSNGESGVSAIVGSNIIVLISDSDQDKSSLSLEKIQSWRLIDSLMPISFTVVAKNTGSNASTATGSATITDWRGESIAEFPFYPDMILANSTRQLRTTPSLEKAAKDPSLIQAIFSYRTLFLLGPYTITATLTSDSSTQLNHSSLTQTVIALPFSLLVVIALSLIAWRFFLLLNTKSNQPTTHSDKTALDRPV
jgi:hypothetical protein